MPDFWKTECLTTDQINAEIWEQSPALQRQIQTPHSLVNIGSVGAQQAMIDGDSDCVLPWVPDLIGRDWKDAGSILVVGSAYAGFIDKYSGRSASMSESSYRREQTVEEFQRAFLHMVVMPDASYYGKIPQHSSTGLEFVEDRASRPV